MIKTQKTYQNPSYTEGYPQHYFIEIKLDLSIHYGFMTDLTDFHHHKKYLKSAQPFYDMLDKDLSNSQLKESNTLLFFHGWNGEFISRLSGYVNSFDRHYIEDKTLDRTISIIWHKGNLGYSASREKTKEFSEKLMNDFIKLTHFLNAGNEAQSSANKCHLLCYSMGNYFFQHIFQQLGTNKKLFNQIILAAPDLDSDVFETGKGFENLPKIADKVTILRHRGDRLLGISKLILKRNRLGRNGLTNFTDLAGIQTIDVTGIGITEGLKDKITHHLYFYKNQHAVDIIRQQLKGGC